MKAVHELDFDGLDRVSGGEPVSGTLSGVLKVAGQVVEGGITTVAGEVGRVVISAEVESFRQTGHFF